MYTMISTMLKKNKKQREFCLFNKYREIFQNANDSFGEKSSVGDFIFFVLHFHVSFTNKRVIFMKKKSKALFGVT